MDQETVSVEAPVKVSQVTAMSPAKISILNVIFFLSGAAALIYEVSWGRQIGLLFGHTSHAAAVVLAAYFAGLAAGYAVGGRIAHRVNPLKAYATAEFVAAAWACLIPWILTVAQSPLFAETLRSDSAAWQLAARAAFSLILLLPATIALGATLPFMAEALTRGNERHVGRVAQAYACNTAGAFAGVVIATSFLLVIAGVRFSGFAAAGLSAVCGLTAYFFALKSPNVAKRTAAAESGDQNDVQVPHRTTNVDQGSDSTGEPTTGLWMILAGLCGFGTLGLEVLYVRLFSLVFHNSTYTFGIVVAVFLAALSLGAWLVGLLARWLRPQTILAISCWGGALSVPLSTLFFVRVTRLEYFSGGDEFIGYMSSAFGLVTLITLLPVTMLGMALPALWITASQHDKSLTDAVCNTTTINTLAAAFGSIAVSFLLLPSLGLWGSFAFVAVIFSVVAGSALLRQQQPLIAMCMGLTVFAALTLAADKFTPEGEVNGTSDERLIQRWNSAYGLIDVVFDAEEGGLKLRQNLHYRFGTTGRNVERIYRQGHLPLLLHPQPSDIAFLGLGTGLTAASSALHKELDTITIVELIPEVVKAARVLGEHNFGIVDHTRVRVEIDDARHFLLGTSQLFDVIVSDLFVPWESETGYMYTVEHYQQARTRLRPGGMFCQWLPLYQLGASDFELIADSFASVFPNTTLWWGNLQSDQAIIALIGYDQQIEMNASQINSRLSGLRATNLFDDDMISTAERLYGQLAGGWTIRHPSCLNTDEHPRVEFHSPLSFGNHQLLQRQILKQYYDSVLASIPKGAARYDRDSNRRPPAGKQRRRSWQRLILFGDQPAENGPQLAWSRQNAAVATSVFVDGTDRRRPEQNGHLQSERNPL